MFEKLKQMVDKAEKIALFTHTHPDGDALGSSFALMTALIQMGKMAQVFLGDGDITTKEYKQARKGDKFFDLSPKECDLKIALDCADKDRIELGGADFDGNTAAIDHHVTHKPFATETIVIDAPATGEIVFDILKEWGVEITPAIADNLYMAIACDTGIFKYSSTTPKTHRVAAELMECGADFAAISRELFYKLSKEYLSLYKTALDRLEIFADGKGCMLYLSEEDFTAANISEDNAGEIVTLPNKIVGVETGIYIRSRSDGLKVSLRSNEYVNVSEIAQEFGGGGHVRASGFTSQLPLAELKEAIKERIVKALRES